MFIGRADAEAEAPILDESPDELTHWKRPCAGKDGRQKKREAEDEMVRQHY